MYRHRRKTLIGHGSDKGSIGPGDAQTESRGVRICIPLARIREYQHEQWAAFAYILSIAVEHHESSSSVGVRDVVAPGGLDSAVKSLLNTTSSSTVDTSQTPKSKKRESFAGRFCSQSSYQTSNHPPAEPISTDESSPQNASVSNGANHFIPSPSPWLQASPTGSEHEGFAQVLHLSALRDVIALDKFVKARRKSGAPPDARVVLDWGELVFDEHAESAGSTETGEVKVEAPAPSEMSSAERKIRRTFAIDDPENVWSTCSLSRLLSSV
jgi:hypothetical protein